jgi:hypothetical protein
MVVSLAADQFSRERLLAKLSQGVQGCPWPGTCRLHHLYGPFRAE